MEDNPIQDSANNDSIISASPSPSKNSAGALPRPKGPNGSAIVLGLFALALAGLVIATETVSLRVDWLALGPGALVGVGALLVVLGAIGLVRRHDDG